MLGVSLGDEEVSRFMVYLEELKHWNRKMNLTSITSDREIITRHFLDSLTPCRLLRESFRESIKLLDIGSGAGFPGIPLKIALPELSVLLMESTEKKVFFMRHVIRRLMLGGAVEAVHARAEDEGIIERYSGSFDCVISRALTGLEEFLALARPYLSEGGLVIAMKGPEVVNEIGPADRVEGMEFAGLREAPVPFTDMKTILTVFRKVPVS